jgi:hypothetical protein
MLHYTIEICQIKKKTLSAQQTTAWSLYLKVVRSIVVIGVLKEHGRELGEQVNLQQKYRTPNK